MAIYDQTRLGELYRLIKKDNPTIPDLTDDTVVVSGITVQTGSKNTSCTITGIKYKGWRGQIAVKYNRIDLATLTKNMQVKVHVPASAEKTLYGILPSLNNALGIFLEQGDFPDAVLSLNPNTLVYEGKIVLAAGHPIYIGELTVSVEGFGVSLDALVTKRELSGPADNSVHQAGKICQTMLQYGVDYSAICQYLKTHISPGTSTTLSDNGARLFAQQLASVDGLPWNWNSAAKDFNLRGCQVYYNGPPKPQFAGSALNPTPDLKYDRVVVFQANPTYCSNLAPGANGWWMFAHYDLVEN